MTNKQSEQSKDNTDAEDDIKQKGLSKEAWAAVSAIAGGITICFYFVRIQVTSWVLCYEPPIVPPPQGHIHRLNDLVQQGISSADLTRIPTGSPVQMAATEHTRQILRQFGIPISISVSGDGNVTSCS